MLKFLKILLRTVEVSFIVFVFFIGSLFFREQAVPAAWVEAAVARVEPPLCAGGPALDLVLAGNAVRGVAERLGELVGATYSADLLDNLFSRFCVGK